MYIVVMFTFKHFHQSKLINFSCRFHVNCLYVTNFGYMHGIYSIIQSKAVCTQGAGFSVYSRVRVYGLQGLKATVESGFKNCRVYWLQYSQGLVTVGFRGCSRVRV